MEKGEKKGKKWILVVFGLVLPLLMIEGGFRFVGAIFLVRQEIQNRKDLSKEGTYRILCLGESTTQGEWPPILEQELNKVDRGIRFKVIDKGVGGTNTAAILWELPGYLDTFKPHMVVSMIGINDGEWVWKEPLEYEDRFFIKAGLVLRGMRVRKVLRFVIDGLKNKWGAVSVEDEQLHDPRPSSVSSNEDSPATVLPEPMKPIRFGESAVFAVRPLANATKNDPPNLSESALPTAPSNLPPNGNSVLSAEPIVKVVPRKYMESEALYLARGEYEKAEALCNSMIETDPENPWGYVELGRVYRATDRAGKAEEMYQTGIKVDPKYSDGYVELGILYRDQRQLEKAEEMFKAGIKADPRNQDGYVELGALYLDQGESGKAEEIYRAGIKADPKNQWGYVYLGRMYQKKGEYDKAEKALQDGIKAAPLKPYGYIELERFFRDQGWNEKVERLYEERIKADQRNPWGYIVLGNLYVNKREYEKAEDVFKRGYSLTERHGGLKVALFQLYSRLGRNDLARQYRAVSYLPPQTEHNYKKLRDIVLGRGIKLICMQYPRHDVAGLVETLGESSGLLYVENKANFENALETHSLADIFRDFFASDFGHCTELGNRLIAENLANTILNEVLGKEAKDERINSK